MSTSNVEIGKRLKQMRLDIGDGKLGISAKAGVSARTWSRWEEGAADMSASALARICKFNGYSLDWLLAGDGQMRRDEAAGDQRLDVELLEIVIETVEDVVRSFHNYMEPGKKAELIVAIYDLYSDTGAKPERERVLRLVKSATG